MGKLCRNVGRTDGMLKKSVPYSVVDILEARHDARTKRVIHLSESLNKTEPAHFQRRLNPLIGAIRTKKRAVWQPRVIARGEWRTRLTDIYSVWLGDAGDSITTVQAMHDFLVVGIDSHLADTDLRRRRCFVKMLLLILLIDRWDFISYLEAQPKDEALLKIISRKRSAAQAATAYLESLQII